MSTYKIRRISSDTQADLGLHYPHMKTLFRAVWFESYTVHYSEAGLIDCENATAAADDDDTDACDDVDYDDDVIMKILMMMIMLSVIMFIIVMMIMMMILCQYW